MSIDKLAHTVWECKCHIVIVPKCRYKIFHKEIKEAVRDELRKLCVWMRIEVIEGQVCEDHIHMCLPIPPEYAISDVVGKLKGKTALRMFKRFPELRQRYWGRHFWSRGYYVTTVGRNEEMIRKYIQEQDKIESQGKLF